MAATEEAAHPSAANSQRNMTPIQAFHEEIKAFYESSQSSAELTKREEAFARVKHSITSRRWKKHHVQVHRFGSSAVGTRLLSSDIDVVVIIERKRALEGCFNPVVHLTNIRSHMDVGFRSVLNIAEKIIPAVVPILKVIDLATGIKVDISCVSSAADHDGVRNSDWIRSRIPDYPNLTKLVVAVKELLRRLEMNSVTSYGVSSYCLRLMVLGFLQHNEKKGDNLGNLLLKFLKWYAKDFNAEEFGIIVTGDGKLVNLKEIEKEREAPLYIRDPIDSTKNAAGKSNKGILPVRAAFALLYSRLKQLIEDSDDLISDKTNFLHNVFEI